MPSKSDSNKPGVLHIVATPIGNLGDLSRRAGEILAAVDLVLAEDTRHSRKLLNGMNIKTPVRAFHKDNETKATAHAIARLAAGAEVALVADAGTPLISDPGFKLVRQAHKKGIRVSPIPGPAALIAALSASGIAPDRFLFEGFAPEKQAARRKRLQALAGESRTLIFYEAPHRITAFLDDAIAVFSGNREASIARELTKKFETIRRGELASLKAWIEQEPNQRRGEFVVVIAGNKKKGASNLEAMLTVLLKSLPLKQSVQIAAELSGGNKNEIYKLALSLQKVLSSKDA